MQVKSAGHALRRRLVVLVVFTVAVLAVAQAAHAHGNDDRGKSGDAHGGESHASLNHADASHANPGSVKVDEEDIDDQSANRPHVACELRIVVNHTFGAPVTIDFDAQPPTTRPGDDQRLAEVTLPAGDNVTDVVDLTSALAGIAPHPQQGWHVKVTVHTPSGGEKHKVFWLSECPAPTTTSTVTSTTVATTVGTAVISGSAQTTTTIPTQVLGENFSKAPTSLANTGTPFSPALAVGLLLGGLVVLGAARHASGRRLELSMRRVNDREP